MTVWELLSWFEECWLDGAWGTVDTPPTRRYVRYKVNDTYGILLRVK